MIPPGQTGTTIDHQPFTIAFERTSAAPSTICRTGRSNGTRYTSRSVHSSTSDEMVIRSNSVSLAT